MMLAELRRHGALLLTGFGLIALLFLATGILLPRKYQSASTILVAEALPIARGSRARSSSVARS
jgi:uncharacterized protein involved in exopolysaccharide biosynthesis